MSFADRLRAFFSKRKNPALGELEAFAREKKGVEGYIEPRTATSPPTLLLVDRTGEHLRAPVQDADDAIAFCQRLALPVYDAQVIGYPKRMREFDKRRRLGTEASLDDAIADLERRIQEEPPGPG